MIVSANETADFTAIVQPLSDNNPFACRIISLYTSYNPQLPFVDYWLVLDDKDEKYRGAIARSGSAFIIFLADNSCVDEVSSFMRVAGATNILCDADYQFDLFAKESTGSVLMKNTMSDENAYKIISENSDNENAEDFAEADEQKPKNIEFVVPDPRTVHELLIRCADENFTPPPFDDFYVDVNHKLRHNAMRMYGINEGDKLVAVAMTVAESDNGAVLGAIACDPDYRKQGYGSAVVSYISDTLVSEGKTVFLHRAANANISFYNNLGFTEIGKWKEYNYL